MFAEAVGKRMSEDLRLNSSQNDDMKYTLRTIILIIMLGIIACGPKQTEQSEENLADTTHNKQEQALKPDPWSNPSETFTGTANDVRIKFQHKDYTSYRLITGVDTTEGTLNTERGFQNDEDATLYILYYDKQDSVLWHFARMSDGMILMLDKDRNVLPDTEFKKE
jgi:hypothetical protein